MSHHSFFSRHNPHPNRVTHIQGLNGNPVCTVKDDWGVTTSLFPHPLIKSQAGFRSCPLPLGPMSPYGSCSYQSKPGLLPEAWREELKELAVKVSLASKAKNTPEKQPEDEPARRKTQYSARTGRIIPPSAQAYQRRTSTQRQAHHPQPLYDQELQTVMLPAVVKLCCGIAYPHLRTIAGLQCTAIGQVIGQEISVMQRLGQIQLSEWMSHKGRRFTEAKTDNARQVLLREEELLFMRQGQEATRQALGILKDVEGWKTEIAEANGDVISSKVLLLGAKKVFRLEAVMEASVEELYDILFVRVEEMHRWNPSIQHVKVLKRIGPETMVTHEVSAETAGNLIGQRDFLSVRYSCKHKSCIHVGGAPVQLEAMPPHKDFVRAEDGPSCFILEPLPDKTTSRLTWLLNMDVKGWLPKSIVSQALPRAQLEFIGQLRRRLSPGTTPKA
ncbi:unnamed protein product [Lota lota]